MFDIEGGNYLMYLPLDQLINNNQAKNNNERQQAENEVNIMDRINANKNNYNLRKRDLYNE